MKQNLYTYENMVAVVTAILAHELGYLYNMPSGAPESERALYKIIERAAHERLPVELKRIIERKGVYERAHVMLLENGFTGWELCKD